MKRVFNTSSEVIHLFANKTQSEAKNSSRNAFFEKENLFSYGYHYKLATHLEGGAILINNGGYSVTTSKHIGEISHASRHLKQFFSEDVFIKNALRRIENLLSKLPRATTRKNEYIASIKSIFNKFQNFQSYCKENKINSIEWSKKRGYWEALEIKTLVDKRSKEWKRLLYIAKSMNDIKTLESETKALQDKEAKKERLKEVKRIKSYRDGKSDFVRLKYDLLSIRERKTYKGTQFEQKSSLYVHTSQNVSIELDEAKNTLKALDLVKYDLELIKSNIIGKKISHYTINKATPQALFIGCHSIEWKEIKRLSKQINKLN